MDISDIFPRTPREFFDDKEFKRKLGFDTKWDEPLVHEVRFSDIRDSTLQGPHLVTLYHAPPIRRDTEYVSPKLLNDHPLTRAQAEGNDWFYRFFGPAC